MDDIRRVLVILSCFLCALGVALACVATESGLTMFVVFGGLGMLLSSPINRPVRFLLALFCLIYGIVLISQGHSIAGLLLVLFSLVVGLLAVFLPVLGRGGKWLVAKWNKPVKAVHEVPDRNSAPGRIGPTSRSEDSQEPHSNAISITNIAVILLLCLGAYWLVSSASVLTLAGIGKLVLLIIALWQYRWVRVVFVIAGAFILIVFWDDIRGTPQQAAPTVVAQTNPTIHSNAVQASVMPQSTAKAEAAIAGDIDTSMAITQEEQAEQARRDSNRRSKDEQIVKVDLRDRYRRLSRTVNLLTDIRAGFSVGINRTDYNRLLRELAGERMRVQADIQVLQGYGDNYPKALEVATRMCGQVDSFWKIVQECEANDNCFMPLDGGEYAQALLKLYPSMKGAVVWGVVVRGLQGWVLDTKAALPLMMDDTSETIRMATDAYDGRMRYLEH